MAEGLEGFLDRPRGCAFRREIGRALPPPEELKKRGASIAASRAIPKSTMLKMIWASEGKIRGPPGEPRAM